MPNYFTFLTSLSHTVSRFISLPIPLIIFSHFFTPLYPFLDFSIHFFYALCLSILYSLPNFIAFSQCFINSFPFSIHFIPITQLFYSLYHLLFILWYLFPLSISVLFFRTFLLFFLDFTNYIHFLKIFIWKHYWVEMLQTFYYDKI